MTRNPDCTFISKKEFYGTKRGVNYYDEDVS
jgi:hypothetical protein